MLRGVNRITLAQLSFPEVTADQVHTENGKDQTPRKRQEAELVGGFLRT